MTTNNDSLDTNLLPKKYKVITVFILYLYFIVMMQAILIYLFSLNENLLSGLHFFLGSLLLFSLGVMTMMILSIFSFHIDERIKNGKPYFNDKDSYRHFMLLASFFLFLITLTIIGFILMSSEQFSIFGKLIGYFVLATPITYAITYFRKKRKENKSNLNN